MSNKNVNLSYSSINDFKQCPKKMFAKRQFKPITETAAFAFGSAFESAVEALLDGHPFEKAYQKFKEEWKVKPKSTFEKAKPVFDNPEIEYNNSDLDYKLFDDISYRLFDKWVDEIGLKMEDTYLSMVFDVQKKLKNEEKVDEKTMQLYSRIMWYSLRMKAKYMIKAFENELLPQIEEVISRQKEVHIANEDKDKVKGYLDFILKLKGIDNPVIVDLKTSSVEYDEHNIDASDQLRIYSASEGYRNVGYLVVSKKITHDMVCEECGHIREKNNLKNCTECKKNKGKGQYTIQKSYAKTQILTKTLSEEDIQDIMEDASEVLVAYKNNIKWKNPNNCFNYNRKCEFYDHCWKGKKLEELEHLTKKSK